MGPGPLKGYLVPVGIAAAIALVAANTDLPGRPGADDGAIVATLADGRTGTIRFKSYQPTRRELARGGHRRRAVALTATLQLPDAGETRVPAAVLMHGSDGVTSHQRQYARRLRESGIATLVLDSFTPRGVGSTVGDQASVPTHAMVVDLFVALDLLASHPRIDPARIAVVGWSKGGVAADWASREWYRSRLARPGQRFAAHAAFYAWCGEQEARIVLTRAPVLLLGGALDDWAGSEACVRYGERARRAGYDVRVIVYPDAHHGFDYDGSFHTYLPNAVSWAACEYLARDSGFVDRHSGHFAAWPDIDAYLSRCSRPGAHVASHAGARRHAREALDGFLAESLYPGG
jgi:dienelactone hydrolase